MVKETEVLKSEMARMRAHAARARFLEDDKLKTFEDKFVASQKQVAALQQKQVAAMQQVAALQQDLSRLTAKCDDDAFQRPRLQDLVDLKDKELADKDLALEALSHELKRLNLDLDISKHDTLQQSLHLDTTPLHSASNNVTEHKAEMHTQTDEGEEEEEEEEEDGEACGVTRVGHAVISAATILMLTEACMLWCGPSFATRMRRQRACFDRLKFFACALYKNLELEEEHSKCMHLQKEVDELKDVDGMQDSVRLMRQVTLSTHRPTA